MLCGRILINALCILTVVIQLLIAFCIVRSLILIGSLCAHMGIPGGLTNESN